MDTKLSEPLQCSVLQPYWSTHLISKFKATGNIQSWSKKVKRGRYENYFCCSFTFFGHDCMTCYLAEEYWMLYFPLCEMYRDILSSASLQTNSLKNHKEGKFQLSPSEEIIWVKHYLHNLFFSKPSFQKDEYFSKTESQTNFNFLKLCKNECQTRFCEATSKEHYNEVFWLCHRNFTKKRLDLPEVETGRPWATAADSQQNICDINKRLGYVYVLFSDQMK